MRDTVGVHSVDDSTDEVRHSSIYNQQFYFSLISGKKGDISQYKSLTGREVHE